MCTTPQEPSDLQTVEIPVDAVTLAAFIERPRRPRGVIIFAHGSGSGRFSPRNQYVARVLAEAGFAAVLPDLLTETEAQDRRFVFDIPLLARRLERITDWIRTRSDLSALSIGYFGASTGAAAALVAAACTGKAVQAIVSRGGRPDLAADALTRVTAPTLLIVGSRDQPVLALNEHAYERLPGPKKLVIIPGATHLFEEPGALEEVARHALDWFNQHLPPPAAT